MSITILTAYDERPDGPGDFVYRAGGTDLQERLRTTGATPHVLDLTGVPGFAGIERTDAGTTIGAGTTVATVARDLAADYPALALTAAGLATPQVRATATHRRQPAPAHPLLVLPPPAHVVLQVGRRRLPRARRPPPLRRRLRHRAVRPPAPVVPRDGPADVCRHRRHDAAEESRGR